MGNSPESCAQFSPDAEFARYCSSSQLVSHTQGCASFLLSSGLRFYELNLTHRYQSLAPVYYRGAHAAVIATPTLSC